MSAAPKRPHVAFVLEQTLGHVTHADNLRRLVPADGRIDPTFLPIDYSVDGVAARIPGYRNWTVRAGLRARRAIRRARRDRPIDALFVHTQVPAVLNRDILGRIPAVVSLDATPAQYDELGEHYGHAPGNRRVEEWKRRANVDCFRRAARIVTWSTWAKQGLVDEYGVEPDKVAVIAPGVDTGLWHRRAAPVAGEAVRYLFVGGDLRRKGGEILLDAFRALRDERRRDAPTCPVQLHIVSRDAGPEEPGVTFHTGLQPNSDELVALYHRCHVFCLPTLGDCLPMVLSEAGAAGLPLVSTAVGAIPEIVQDGRTGLLVQPGDVSSLVAALRRLADDGELRERLGGGARTLVDERFDAGTNASAVVDLLIDIARRRP